MEQVIDPIVTGAEQVVEQASGALTDDVKTQDDALPTGPTGGGTGGTTFTVANATENRDEETLNDVATALAAKTEAGSTLPTLGSISTTLDGAGKVASASVTVTETVTLPKWTKRDTQCDRHKAEWDRFLTALTAHEQGHVAIDRKYFENITAKLVGLKDSDVDAKVAATQALAQTDNDTFDATTAHGTNAGTSIDAGTSAALDKVD